MKNNGILPKNLINDSFQDFADPKGILIKDDFVENLSRIRSTRMSWDILPQFEGHFSLRLVPDSEAAYEF